VVSFFWCVIFSGLFLFLVLALWNWARRLVFLSLAGFCFVIAGLFWVLKMLAMAVHWAVTPRSSPGGTAR